MYEVLCGFGLRIVSCRIVSDGLARLMKRARYHCVLARARSCVIKPPSLLERYLLIQDLVLTRIRIRGALLCRSVFTSRRLLGTWRGTAQGPTGASG